MKNQKDFVKLFNLNIPNYQHLEYYLEQLSKTGKFKDIKLFLQLFEEVDSNIDNFYEYKLEKSNQIIDFIKLSNTYTELTLDKNIINLPTHKSIHYQEGSIYLSVDLKSGNWQSLKLYDQQNELGDSYEEFLSRFELPKVFIHSKYLRQFIFGNVNPKRQQIVQRSIIQNIIRQFDAEFEIEGVKNDEVIFILKDFKDSKKVINNIDNEKYHYKIFTCQRVEDFRIDTHYDENGNFLTKEMVGVNAHKFYWKLKQYITGEKIDIRDLYFRSEGELAIWNHPDLKIDI
jgi:hypothetical protein